MALEILDVAFVLLCFLNRVEGSEVTALAGGRIFLARVQAKLAGFEFSYHVMPSRDRQGIGSRFFRTGFPGRSKQA